MRIFSVGLKKSAAACTDKDCKLKHCNACRCHIDGPKNLCDDCLIEKELDQRNRAAKTSLEKTVQA
jgi:hypothetical protein